MKIIVDAYQYSKSVTGTDRMAYNYLSSLQQIDNENSYVVLCSRETYNQRILKNSNFKILKPPFVVDIPFFGRYFAYFWRRLTKLRLIRLKADAYLSFHNMQLPGRRVAKKMIASNLDLIPIVLADYTSLGRRSLEEQKAEYSRVANLADHIVSISNFSKKELCDLLNIPGNKVSTVHLAADPMFSKTSTSSLVKNSKAIHGDYIFTIGGTEPRKDVNTVVDAYLKLPASMRSSINLVIAGGEWHGRKLDALKKADGIITLGFVPDEQLVGLYKNSKAFVFASWYEGFGFAILEAMSCGTPVITASGTSLDEVAGDAALKFTPGDTDELEKKLEEALTNDALRKKLTDLGKKRTAEFSWEKSANLLHKILTDDISPSK